MHPGGGILEVTVLTFCLLFVAAIVSLATRRIRLPLSVALVVLGLAAGSFAQGYHESHGFLAGAAEAIRGVELTPELLLFIFLPTLLFESAYNLELRRLLKNLLPILLLAIPGLVISTLIVGGIMSWFLGLALLPALLFGAMISATDPVAVIAIFKQVGAPRRLVTLVEGESLCNDATAIVLFGLLYGLIEGSGASAVGVAWSFLYVFAGGALVGAALGVLIAKIIERVENDPLVEITLTTVLAYLSFIAADHFLHVSGVMSTVAAGLVVGGYGRTKISAPVLEFMHSFWEYLAYVANAIVFLLVGIFLPSTVSGMDLGSLVGPVAAAVLAALGARAVAVFGLVPLLGRLRPDDRVDLRYQTVLFWGGLRGAVALVLALSLLGRPGLPPDVADLFLALTAGVVLFTLIVNAVSVRGVVHLLGLDRETRAERMLRAESMLTVKRDVQRDLERLRREGIFLPRVLEGLVEEVRGDRRDLEAALASEPAMSEEETLRVHRIQMCGVEKQRFLGLFAQGALSETAALELCADADRAADRWRDGEVPADDAGGSSFTPWPLVRLAERVPVLGRMMRRLQRRRVAHLYETAWGRLHACRAVLAELERLGASRAVEPELAEILEEEYGHRRARAESGMDEIAEQFPEYVTRVQETVGHRMRLHTEMEGYRRLLEEGVLSQEACQRLVSDLEERLRHLRKAPVEALDLEPSALLGSVPLFAGIGAEERELLAGCLVPRSCVPGEVLFREGETGETMYLIGRGVIKIWRGPEEAKEPVATLTAGSFVGEMALLHPGPRTATVQTATVASLLELRKSDLDEVIERQPSVGRALEDAYRRRKEQLDRPETPTQERHLGGFL